MTEYPYNQHFVTPLSGDEKHFDLNHFFIFNLH